MNEDKLRRQAGRGSRAEELLSNELFKEAFDTLERTYIDAWKQTHLPEESAREKYWHAVSVLIDVRNHISAIARDGRVAKKEIDQLGGLNRL